MRNHLLLAIFTAGILIGWFVRRYTAYVHLESSMRHEVAWRGNSLATAEYWMNGIPLGSGEIGFRQLVKQLCEVSSEASITFKMPIKDRLAYDNKYQMDDELPYGERKTGREIISGIIWAKNLRIATAELEAA